MSMVSYLYKKYEIAFALAGISELSLKSLIDKLGEPHRFYHNITHVSDILFNIGTLYSDEGKNKYILILTALFHDAIYDPRRKDNEERSVDFFKKCIGEHCHKENADIICSIIMDTKTHEPSSELSKKFCDLDLYGLKYGKVERILIDEQNIFKEFQFYDYSDYRKGRLEFLEAYRKKINNDFNVDFLKGILTFRRPKIGVYAGSFSPLHLGHRNIIEKAEEIFDKVIIAKGYNPEKKEFIDGADILFRNNAETQKENLQRELPYHQVEVFSGFLTEYLTSKSLDADIFLIRGLRNGKDLDYEVNQLRFLEDLDNDIKVVFIHCDKEYEHISSSAIKAMERIKTGSASRYIKYGL